MEYIGTEVGHKIRSAIKAKLMELGAYVDEELPDYIMVMVANKRQKAQMDGDLQLFLGSNTSHFTSWLYQVLQKLQEVSVGNLDKKSSKISSSAMKDTTTVKRKSGSLDGDSHRKEKRRKSSDSRKSKKSENDLLRDSKKDPEGALKLSSKDPEQLETKYSKSKEFVSSSRPDNSDSVVSSSADSKINKKTLMRGKIENIQDSNIVRRNSVKSLSNGSSKLEEKTYLSCLRSDALKSRDDRSVSHKPSASNDRRSIVSSKDGIDAKVAGSKIIYGQSQRTKIVLMNSDDDEDDEDFINIKADAEAEQLLQEELPREALETSISTPEKVQAVAEPSESQKKTPEGPIPPPELPTIPLKENLVPKRPFVKEVAAAPDPQPTATHLPAAPLNLPIPTVPISTTRILRKRNADTEVVAVESKLSKEEERPIGTTLSIRERLGMKRPATVTVTTVLETKATERMVVVPVVSEQTPTLAQMELNEISETIPKRATANTHLLSRVVTLRERPRPEGRSRSVEVRSMKREDDEDEEEEYDPSNPAVGTVASIVRVKPRPKLPASLQANKKLILKAVAEAQKSVASVPIRTDPSRPAEMWKRTSVGFGRKLENNVGVTLPNRRLQSFKEREEEERGMEEDEDDENIKPDSTRHVSSGNGHDKIIIKVSSTNPEKGQESVQSTEEMSDDENAEHILHYQEEEPLTNDDADTPSSGRSVYPPVGLASRMPRERSTQTQTQQYSSPQFLVTLDGLDPDMFSLRSSSLEEQNTSKEDFDLENAESSGSLDIDTPKTTKTPIVYKVEPTAEDSSEPNTLPKSLERCKYWPLCRLGGKCNFHHPVTPCKTFPKCPFGDKCLYIHPFCKFNSACTRRDCSFVHAAPRTLLSSVPRPTSVPKTTFAPICRFFPKCSNVSCKFLHPKTCRYGRFCSKQDCNFIHQELPSVDKLKWTSPFKT